MCEIFQWKGQLEAGVKDNLSSAEVVHLGEEIADVFIYATRLCDVCKIDLSRAVQNAIDKIGPNLPSFTVRYEAHSVAWHTYTFNDLLNDTRPFKAKFRSQRQICFALQTEMGKVCDYFSRRPESESAPGLPMWPDKAVNHMIAHLATMCILLSCLAHFHNISLAQCISEKFVKNARKYPADKAKGSSAKYTNYTGSQGLWCCIFPRQLVGLEILDFSVRLLTVTGTLCGAAYYAHSRGLFTQLNISGWFGLFTGPKRIGK